MRCVMTLLVCWSVAQHPTSGGLQPTEPSHPFPSPVSVPRFSKDLIFTATSVLTEDLQVPALAPTGTVNTVFHLHGAYGPLTFIINPCNGTVNVTMYHVPQTNSSGLLKNYIEDRTGLAPIKRYRGSSQRVFSWSVAPPGLYLLDLAAELQDSRVTLFATNQPEIPAALRIRHDPKVRISRRLHRHRVTLRWDQSVVDPQMMHYYVVVSSKQNFTSLCQAMSKATIEINVHNFFTKVSEMENKIHKKASYDEPKHLTNFNAIGKALGENDTLVANVGTGLSYTLGSLQKGRNYFFNIFAQNKQTKLSFLYGNTTLRYDLKTRPMGLKDNKPVKVNIRKLGGRALFRYKVRNESTLASNILNWHVMPCGGVVLAEVRSCRNVIVPRQMVEGYRQLQVPSVKPGSRYTLIISVPDATNMRQILGVEVLATMKTSLMPQLPVEAKVHEFSSMRTCDSVTVAWLPTPDSTQSVRYCVSASPVPITESEAHFRPRPNQCNLDNRLRTQFDFTVKQCQDFSANDHRNVLVQTIHKLRPGKEYLIQVTVKKIKGKALSYDLLRVRTKSVC